MKKQICCLLLITVFFISIPLQPAFADGIDKETILKGLGLTLLLILLINYGRETLGDSGLPDEEEMVVLLSAREFDLLQRIIHAEAEGESYQGKVAVGAVVLNRIKSPLFPNNLQDVLYADNQFEPVQDGRLFLTPGAASHQAALDALRGEDPSKGALYFYNRQLVFERGDIGIINWFDQNTSITVIIGNHTFAR